MVKKAIASALLALAFALVVAGCGTSPSSQQENVEKMTKGVEAAESIRDAANSRISGYDPSKAEDANAVPAQDLATYEEVLADYSARIREATPRLVDEFNAEAKSLKGDKNALAQLSNDKIAELAKISNEGAAEMSRIMRANGDDFNVYENWAGKLTDIYLDEANAITDAYMKAAA